MKKMENKKIKTIERNISINCSQVIDRLLWVLKLSNSYELAEYFNVSAPTISSWRTRNSMDWELVIAKLATTVNINWLATGKGNPKADLINENELMSKYIATLEENVELRKKLTKK